MSSSLSIDTTVTDEYDEKQIHFVTPSVQLLNRNQPTWYHYRVYNNECFCIVQNNNMLYIIFNPVVAKLVYWSDQLIQHSTNQPFSQLLRAYNEPGKSEGFHRLNIFSVQWLSDQLHIHCFMNTQNVDIFNYMPYPVSNMSSFVPIQTRIDFNSSCCSLFVNDIKGLIFSLQETVLGVDRINTLTKPKNLQLSNCHFNHHSKIYTNNHCCVTIDQLSRITIKIHPYIMLSSWFDISLNFDTHIFGDPRQIIQYKEIVENMPHIANTRFAITHKELKDICKNRYNDTPFDKLLDQYKTQFQFPAATMSETWYINIEKSTMSFRTKSNRLVVLFRNIDFIREHILDFVNLVTGT